MNLTLLAESTGNRTVCEASRVHQIRHREAGALAGMAFIMEFAENWIRQSMEDPEEQDRKFREHIEAARKRRERNKHMWAQPVKPFGYWNNLKHNRVYYNKLKESNARGKTDPLDELKADPFANLQRPPAL